MAKRGKPTGNKRQRERDKRRKREDKEARRAWRKGMRARGLDPDLVDEEGNPLPVNPDNGLGVEFDLNDQSAGAPRVPPDEESDEPDKADPA